MTKEELYQLTAKFLDKTLSAEEQQRLDQWYKGGIDEEVIINVSSESPYNSESELKSGLLRQINRSLANEDVQPVVHRIHFLKTAWFRYAAAIILIAGGAAIWYTQSAKSDQSGKSAVQTVADVAPGGNKAILTLADGTKIVLDNAANGNLAQQGNTKIIKLDAGQLAYNTGANLGKEVLFNTISTPRGGQYQIVLPDGSKVWLNAASSIKFPTAFTGATREVEMSGEVYIEVAKNMKQPFMVKANGIDVQVLGTSFNINAYTNEEAVKTTLVEGSIKVRVEDKEEIMKPGQQCSVTNGRPSLISNADVDKVLAWKNGLFNFNGADLQTVMRQLERWYDIKVKYEGPVPDMKFQGELNRGVNLSDILKYMGELNIRSRLEAGTLIVSKR